MATSRFLYRVIRASSAGRISAAATTSTPAPNTGPSGCGEPDTAGSCSASQPSIAEEKDSGSSSPAPEKTEPQSPLERTGVGNLEPPTKRPKIETSSDSVQIGKAASSEATDSKEEVRTEQTGGEAREIKGVIFDMDGTLTIPVLNFVAMRAELQIPVGADILPTVFSMPQDKREEAMRIIEKWEEEGARKLQLQPGVVELLEFIAESQVRRALMTRNSMTQTEVCLDRIKEQVTERPEAFPNLAKGAVFEEVLTRDFRPVKPDPAAVHHICKCWSLEPWQVAVVGDDKTDMTCGRRAGVGVTILLKNERNRGQEHFGDFAVDSLADVLSLFSSPISVVREDDKAQ